MLTQTGPVKGTDRSGGCECDIYVEPMLGYMHWANVGFYALDLFPKLHWPNIDS